MREDALDLSIIIVNWNTRDELIGCLDSIAGQRQAPCEVFVIDNHSRDGSAEAVREKHPWVTLVENEENLGFARAANIGLECSRGRYVVILNPDTTVREGTLEAFLAFMEAHPDAGIAGGQLFNPNASKQNSIANFPSLATELLNKSLLRWLFPKIFPGKGQEYSGPIEVDSVVGACMVVRRDAVQSVGLLDEGYFLFFEETDWCYRMKGAGWKVYHVPQFQIVHFQGKSAAGEKKRAKLEYYRSRYRFFKKNRGRWAWLLLHIGLLIKLVVELISLTAVCLVTLFAIEKWKKKLSIAAYLLLWHLRLCPKGMGLT
jgi:GT2 family glycosyltransferase